MEDRILFIVPDAEDLKAYNTFIDLGDESVDSQDFTSAEVYYGLAVGFCEQVWGPYTWLEARVLYKLSYLYKLQGRKLESELASLLASKILASEDYPEEDEIIP